MPTEQPNNISKIPSSFLENLEKCLFPNNIDTIEKPKLKRKPGIQQKS